MDDDDDYKHYYSDTSDDDNDSSPQLSRYLPRSDTASLLQSPFSSDATPLAGSRSRQTRYHHAYPRSLPDRRPAPSPRQQQQTSRPPARAYPSRFHRPSSSTSSAASAPYHSPTPHTIDARHMAGDKDRSSAHSDDDIPLAAGAKGREWQHQQQRRPLIDMVTNEWQKNLNVESDSDDEFYYAEKRNWYTPAIITLLVHGSRRVPRRVQRTVCLAVGFLVAAWLGWRWILQPYWHEQTSFAEAVSGSARWGVYGSNARPSFNDMVHVKQLDPSLLPSSSADNQRLVFVGDVHGCKSERKLLQTNHFHC